MPTLTRRSFAAALLAAPVGAAGGWTRAQAPDPRFSYPIGLPGRVLGDGFVVRHGYATENTWYNPGWLHTGEDWYVIEGDTAGAVVYAVAAGEVVYAGFDYPGPVVIVRHAPDLFSMYGHLDDALDVEPGERLAQGQRLGTVLGRNDGRAPSHLHFEIRTFLTHPEVNGAAPRYGVGCGFECPPGPGYWPIEAPEHPTAVGWRNPTHVINGRAFPAAGSLPGAEVVVAAGAREEARLYSRATGDVALPTPSLTLVPGRRFPLLAATTGPAAGEGTSAEAYALRYLIALDDGGEAWVQAAVPSDDETGSDGRPSTIRFDFLPAKTVPK